MRVWMSPKRNNTNMFNNLLSSALEDKELEVNQFSWKRIFEMKGNDVVHFHWIHHMYQSNSKFIFLLKIVKLFLILVFFKLKRVKVIWTIHNVYPHSYKYIHLEKRARKMMINFCFRVIVTGEFIKKEVIEEFGVDEEKIYVIPHGHYKDAYSRTGNSIRNKYKIPEGDFVFLFFGVIKPYKGVEKLVEAFNNIGGNSTSLMIAGKPFMNMDKIEEAAKNNPKIHLDLDFIPDDQIADIICSSNAVVLPYDEITTSGSAILALSFERPIVAPSSSFFKEYFNDKISVLYNDSKSIGNLEQAMRKVLELNSAMKDFEAVLSKLEWSNIADMTIKCYNGTH